MTARASRTFDFWGSAYLLVGPYLGRLQGHFSDLAPELPRAGLRVTFRAYLAGMVVASMGGALGGGIAGFLVAAYYLRDFGGLGLVAVLGFALLGGAVTFSSFYVYPQAVASSRGRRLSSQLSFMVGQMAVLATAGVTPERMFHSLAEEDPSEVVGEEARMIVRDMSLLGMDLDHALEAAKRRSPSEDFTVFLDGFLSASKTGGDVKNFLLRSASSLMLEKRLKARAIGESVGFVAELYTILLVVAPLLLLIMFSVMGIVVGSFGGFSILNLILIVTYAVVPLGGLAVLVIADSTISGEMA